MEEDFNYQEDLAIDLDNLEIEWQDQAGLYMKYATALAHQERVAKKAWEKVKVVRSKLTKEAKENGMSNASLQEAYYRDHDDHKNAKTKLIEEEYKRDMLLNAVMAFVHRRAALENEVRLWQGSWFAGPKEPKEVQGGKRIMDTARDKKVQKGRADVNDKRKRRI